MIFLPLLLLEIDDFVFSFFHFISFTFSRETALIFNDTLDGHPSRWNEISWKNPRCYLDKFDATCRGLETRLRKNSEIVFEIYIFHSP